MTENLFVSCAEHLEPLLLKELETLGIEDAEVDHHGVNIPISLENIYKVNYLSRIATRALLPLLEFKCPDQDALYREVKKIDWSQYLNENLTIAIDANVFHPKIRHSLYAAQLVKDAICDQMRDKNGTRPSVDIKNPDVQLNLFIKNNKAVLSFDTSGAPLYKRGWKEVSTEATLPETLAAALLMLSNYSSNDTLCDPFCGAGTLLFEAACIASQTPAGYYRSKWGFFHLPAFSQETWEKFKSEWDAKRTPLSPQCIIGADSDAEAIALCKKYAKKLGFEKVISLIHSPVDKLKIPRTPTLVVTDPPFGKRMETDQVIYKQLGKFLRAQCPATPFAYLICPSFSLVKATGCTILSEKPLTHGGMNLNLFQLSI